MLILDVFLNINCKIQTQDFYSIGKIMTVLNIIFQINIKKFLRIIKNLMTVMPV